MPIIKNDDESLMVRCSCGSHALEITLDDFAENSIPQISMGIWTHGQRPLPLRWRDRLRWIWYILKDGKLHADDIIVNEKDAIVIANYLSEKSCRIQERIHDLEKKHSDKVLLNSGKIKFVM